MPNGTIIRNVPKGISRSQLIQKLEKAGYDTGLLLQPQPSNEIGPIFRPSSYGYFCTDDCGGHLAGYQWGAEQGISDPDDCGGNSQSFEEGCRAYAEEQGY